MNEIASRLCQRCSAKLGTVVSERGQYCVFRGSLHFFAVFDDGETAPSVLLRIRDEDRLELAKTHAGIRQSAKMHWKTQGWTWMDVPTDGSVPESVVGELVDRSYQLLVDGSASDSFDEFERLQLEMLGQKLSGRPLLAALIERLGLAPVQASIEGVVEPALLLRTSDADESLIAAGASKIGGMPDLPPDTAWPVHSKGKPLAFLAQINLSEAAAVLPLAPLPPAGVVQFFSVYGWQEEGCTDPALPKGKPRRDWTQVLYHASDSGLVRRATPDGLDAFTAAAVEFVPILTLPGDSNEPTRQKLDLSDEQDEQFTSLCDAFGEIASYQLGYPAKHQLLGYGFYEQGLEETQADEPPSLVFQLASDNHTQMWWGDGGYLYFSSPPELIAKKDFSQLATDYQCG